MKTLPKNKNKNRLVEDIRSKTEPDVADKDAFYLSARKFFIENGALTDYDFNDMVVLTHMASKSIKHTEFFIDKNAKKVKQIIYLGRLSFVFKNKRKLKKKIYSLIEHLLQGYEYSFEVDLYTHSMAK